MRTSRRTIATTKRTVPVKERERLTNHYASFIGRNSRIMQNSVIAGYNNEQKNFADVEAWFERAIELAQAQEMWKELEAPVEVKELKKGDVVCSLK